MHGAPIIESSFNGGFVENILYVHLPSLRNFSRPMSPHLSSLTHILDPSLLLTPILFQSSVCRMPSGPAFITMSRAFLSRVLLLVTNLDDNDHMPTNRGNY